MRNIMRYYTLEPKFGIFEQKTGGFSAGCKTAQTACREGYYETV